MESRSVLTLKSNSTSTIFAQSSLAQPDMDQVMLSLAIVLQLQMIQDQNEDLAKIREFSFFDDGSASTIASAEEKEHPLPEEKQMKLKEEKAENESTEEAEERPPKKAKIEVVQVPTLDQIYKFIHAIYQCAQFSPECNIISLVFINRLLANTGMPLYAGNWRPVLVTAILIAQKIWDDRSLINAQFSTICPMFKTADINNLERKFLELIDYDVTLGARLYAKYYFELRSLCEVEARNFNMKPLTKKQVQRLEKRSAVLTKKGQSLLEDSEANRRKTTDMIDKKSKNLIIN